MLIQTHRKVAKLVHAYMFEKYAYELNLKELLYGSVKPDFSWEKREYPHYYNESIHYFTRELGSLANDRRYLDIGDFSNGLGKILHFTADYLCQAHNNGEIRHSKLSHINYEIALHREFRIFDPKADDQHLICGHAYKQPLSIVQDMRKKYLLSSPGVNNDISYIMAASAALTENLAKRIFRPLSVVA